MADKEAQPQVDDVVLVLQMMEKDEDALTTVLAVYGPKVRGFLKQKFGDVLKEPELDEVFNRAAFNVWRFADRFRPERGNFRGWFIRIARNMALSVLRGETRHLAKDLEYDPAYDPADDFLDTSPDVDSKDFRRLNQLDDFLQNKLTGFERIVGLNCFKSGGEPDTARLAALHGKTRQNVDTVRSKVKKKITQAMLDLKSRQDGGKGKP